MQAKRNNSAIILLCSIGISLLASVIGCSGNSGYPDTAPVRGVLIYKGKPLPDANVSFIPLLGRPASATTNANGEFELTTFTEGDGAIPGEHQVIVEKLEQTTSQDLYAQTKSAIPKKYAELRTTPLKLAIPPEGDLQLRIELTD